MGDLPSYDAFTLGGPYSVRGYNMGELGAARNILEVRRIGDTYFFSQYFLFVFQCHYLCFAWKRKLMIKKPLEPGSE